MNVLVYQIATMFWCIKLKFGFHVAMNVGFSKQFRFSCIMMLKVNTRSMQLIIYYDIITRESYSF